MNQFTFSFIGERSQTETVMKSGHHFKFDIEEYARYFFDPLPTRMIDLLRIAAAIYFSDRLVRRKDRKQQRYWSRSISLRVGVIDLDFWNRPSVQELLTETIEFLSDDRWNFTFEHNRVCEFGKTQRGWFAPPAMSRVALVSGGLDSAAGIGVQLSIEPSVVRLPVTVWHQPIQRKVVLRQHRMLFKRFNSLALPLIIKTELIWTPELKNLRQEFSQRSRAFLFTAAGAVAAVMNGGSSVDVLESGVGAINLPFMTGMVGSKTTRSCHPEFHRRMAKLVSKICERRFSIDLPFFHLTKGEMVKQLAACGLSQLSHRTVSCVHFPLRDSKFKQCGVCAACILRRQSMLVAGIREAKDTYKFDLFHSAGRANNIPKEHSNYLYAILNQLVQLSEVQEGMPLPSRVQRHLLGTDIVSAEHPLEIATRVLCTYRDEWKPIIARANACGISWTNLVATGAEVL